MKFIESVQIDHPIIQAPMAGVTTPEFVAASASAGVLGSIGAGYLSTEATRDFIRCVRILTNKSFAVNLFVPEEMEPNVELIRRAYANLQPIGEQLGMPSWETPFSAPCFEEQVQVVIEEGVPVCSFTFGLPSKDIVQRLKAHHVFLIGTATSVEEAVLAEKGGMDAIVLQGKEAGGHRGSFIGEALIPLETLIADVVGHVQIPTIAAGGIANKAQMKSMLDKGAQAVQLGTALLATDESGAHPLYKKAVLQASEGCTELTKAFSGKSARGIRNQFMIEMKNQTIAPYPIQNDLTKKIRSEAAAQNRPEFMSMWAGERVHESLSGTVSEVLRTYIR